MNFYRCEICGDVYMGTSKPSNCPYCGSEDEYLVPAKDWVDENASITELSSLSRENLQKAMQLEVNNAPFYRDASANTDDIELQGMFKCLAKIEAEHVSVIKKILKCEPPAPEPGREKATANAKENLRLAHAREVFAAGFYERAAEQAVEPRVQKVFTALAEIESDHIDIEAEMLD